MDESRKTTAANGPHEDDPVQEKRRGDADGADAMPVASTSPKKKAPSPTLARIMLWGAVFGVIVCTAMYFLTYESDGNGPSTAERGILFYKIAPQSIPGAFKVPDPAMPPSSEPFRAPVQPAPEPTPAAARAAPEPAAIAATPSGNVPAYAERSYPYVVHVASYRSVDVARKMAAEYSRGFHAFLVQTELGKKGVWYRLFIGHFPDATSAADAIEKYFSKGTAVVGHTRYACLVGSYVLTEQADAVSGRLTEEGFLPFTVSTHGAHHVFVGAHPTRATAEALSRDLSAKGFPNTLIRR